MLMRKWPRPVASRLGLAITILLVPCLESCKHSSSGSEIRSADSPATTTATAAGDHPDYTGQCGNAQTLVAMAESPAGRPDEGVALTGRAGLGLADTPSLAQSVKSIFDANCQRCHNPASDQAPNNFNNIYDRTQLLSKLNMTAPEQSKLYKRVLSGSMPEDTGKMGDADIATVLAWIKSGAPDINGGGGNAPSQGLALITEKDKISCIFNDFTKSVLPRDQPFTRYFTLTHYYNAGMADSDLEKYRQSLSKLANSLSLGKNVVKPIPIDPTKTIFRIDLRLYKWSTQTWAAVLAKDNYLISAYGDASMDQMLQTFFGATGGRVVHTRADSFAETASIPPLYYTMLGIPDTAKRLEDSLGVNLLVDIDQRLVLRAGFTDSGVSNNNRMIERHDATTGFYWTSYDFSSSAGAQNLVARPLGPCFAGDPPSDLGANTFLKRCSVDDATLAAANVFKHAGGESIYSLPNGFQGYMLVNNEGKRLDKGPINIVKDKSRPDSAVIDGLSCMGCHSKGMIRKQDVIRQVVQQNSSSYPNVDAILGIYKTQDHLDAAFGQDEQRFANAMTAAGVTPTGPEPITAQVAQFEGPVSAKMAAGEFGISPQDFASRLAAASDLTQELGSLTIASGSVQRDTFGGLFLNAFARLSGFGGPTGGSPTPGGNPTNGGSVATGWSDVTPGGCATSSNCMYKNNASGLRVTKNQPNAVWDNAVQKCQSLSYGGFSSGWRLPTFDELVKLQADGIKSLAAANFITAESITQFYFWSASTDSSFPSNARVVDLVNGDTFSNFKALTYAFVCVR